MGKIINLSAVLEKEEKLQQVVDYMEELKDQFSDLIQEYEDDGADVRCTGNTCRTHARKICRS